MEQERAVESGYNYRLSVKVSIGAECDDEQEAQELGEQFSKAVEEFVKDGFDPVGVDDIDMELEVLPLVRVPNGSDSDTVLAMEASRESWHFWWQVPDDIWYVAKEGTSLVYVNVRDGWSTNRMVVNGIRPRRFTEDGTELIDATDRSENIELTPAPSTPLVAIETGWVPWTRPIQFVD